MVVSDCVLVGIFLVVWCQQFSANQRIRFQHDSDNRHHLEKSNIALKYPTKNTLRGKSVVKYPTQDTIRERYKPVFVPCGNDMCLCSKTDANCLHHGGQLTYIPKLPKTIQRLNFSGNYLPYLDNLTFSNLTSLYLTGIELGMNNLTNCTSNVFGNLNYLRNLTLRYEKVSSESLKQCFASINSKFLNRFYLFDLIFTHRFKSDLFSEMKNSSVRKVNMYGSTIKIYNQSAFSPFTKLDSLVLNDCDVRHVLVDYAPNLKYLALEFNHLIEIPDFCKNGRNLYPKMVSLILDYNDIKIIHHKRLECLHSLRTLSLVNNNIYEVHSNTFFRIPKLSVVSLKYNSHHQMIIRAHAFNSSSLTSIDLHGNNVYLDNKELSFDAFKDCPNLKFLNLKQNRLHKFGNTSSDAALHRLLGSLSNLEELNLVRTKILDLPIVIPQRMPKLQKLYAHENFVSEWPADYFHNLKHLRELDLRENRITVITQRSFSKHNLRTFKLLNFEGNTFSCNCDLLWFLDYLKNDNGFRKYEYWPTYYTCYSPPEFQGVKLKDVPLNDHICLEQKISAPIICVSATFMILVFCFSFVYRHRWTLRYLVYMIRFQQTRYQRILENDNYLYDLYLSSSEDDFDFILDHIVPKLEQELGLRLYIPQRDGIGYRVDAIVSNMDVSKKALLFVSDSYAQDQYCQLKATIASDRYVGTRRNMMIVVLLNEPVVSKTIHTILNVDEYIMWSNGEENVRLFWRKLENALFTNDDLRY